MQRDRAHGRRALLARAPSREPGGRASCATGSRRWTRSAPASPPARSPARRRCARWRSSTRWSRSAAVRTAARSATSRPASKRMDLAITIRTCVIANGVASVQSAAGVVYDSVPERELLEHQNKARALLTAIGQVRRTATASPLMACRSALARRIFRADALQAHIHRRHPQSFELRTGATLVVGRAPNSDIPVIDPTISRRHAEVECDDDGRHACATSDRATARSSTARGSTRPRSAPATSSRSARSRSGSQQVAHRRHRHRRRPRRRRRDDRAPDADARSGVVARRATRHAGRAERRASRRDADKSRAEARDAARGLEGARRARRTSTTLLDKIVELRVPDSRGRSRRDSAARRRRRADAEDRARQARRRQHARRAAVDRAHGARRTRSRFSPTTRARTRASAASRS